MKEEWRWIKGYEGMYIISDAGRVMSLKKKDPKILSQFMAGRNRDRLAVLLCKESKYKGMLIYRALVESFKGGIPEGMVVDHKDGDPSNNNLSNLRVATHAQNSFNQKKKSTPSISKYKGVSFCNRKKRWVARLAINKKHKRNGTYKTQEEAALAYNELALKYFGEFAHLNIVSKAE